MSNDLIKRYVYAVISYLPTKTQPEVGKEIENMIAEMLDARCGDTPPTDEDIRAVLTELGTPEELAVKYSGEESKALLSGIYFLWFKKVVKIVAPIAAAGVGLAILLSVFIEWQPTGKMLEYIPEQIAKIIAGAFSAAVQSVLWIGLIFVIFEHKKVKFDNSDYLGSDFISRLRPVPSKQSQIKMHEPILNVFWNIAAAVLFLGFPYLMGGYWKNTGWIPAFDESYIRASWFFIIFWVAFGIGQEIIKLFERRYSKKVALATVISNVLSGAAVTMFFANGHIMNPVFTENLKETLANIRLWPIEAFAGNLNMFILGIILITLLAEIGVTIYRAIRYDR